VLSTTPRPATCRPRKISRGNRTDTVQKVGTRLPRHQVVEPSVFRLCKEVVESPVARLRGIFRQGRINPPLRRGDGQQNRLHEGRRLGGRGEKASSENEDIGERKTALVYQIWDKDGGKKLRYISPQYNDGYLKVEDDPLELTGFFNCPKPIQFLEKSNDLSPVALYELYENQAKELNQLTFASVVSSKRSKPEEFTTLS
jgi:hypothetical protein